MKLKNICLTILFVPVVLFAQRADPPGNAGAGNSHRLPDNEADAWESLNGPHESRVTLLDQFRSRGEATRSARAAAFSDAASLAQEFYSRFPDSANAITARKLEAQNLIDAVGAGATEQEEAAYVAGMRFRNDQSNPEDERFQIASAMVNMKVRRRHLEAPEDILAEYEHQADNLLAEFPDNTEVYRMYVGVMRTADPETAARVANKVLSIASPPEIKKAAINILDHINLTGTTLDLAFEDAEGELFDIQSLRGKIVVIEAWNHSTGRLIGPSDLKSLNQDVKVVSINLDSDADSEAARSNRASSKKATASYFDSRGLDSPIALQLHIYDVPRVIVLDTNGVVVGSGGYRDLSDLLAKAQ